MNFNVGDVVAYVGQGAAMWEGYRAEVIMIERASNSMHIECIQRSISGAGLLGNRAWVPADDNWKVVVRKEQIVIECNVAGPECKCERGGWHGHDAGCPAIGFYSKKSTAYFT